MVQLATPGEREPNLARQITICPFIGQNWRWEILPIGGNGALGGNTERMRARYLKWVKTPRLDGLTGFDWNGYLTHCLLLISGADIGHFQEGKEASKRR